MCKPEIRFDIINPVTNNKKPHYDTNKNLYVNKKRRKNNVLKTNDSVFI